eukprot:CAMPEP_0179333830 /NCGR_PEP_ID=MMETSP0797-20121207/65583_1 /TAXON_ID=47934 /ORGANISM="Dinophysis acuminata, Strain DAEP01" /LENGTH=30 /DNA_ID= /DNA_START= /DNA_END= /DNA_ORIENTATION=
MRPGFPAWEEVPMERPAVKQMSADGTAQVS